MKVSDTTWIQWTLLQLADLELDRGRLAQADDWLAGLADTEPKVLPSERAPSKLELRRVQDPTNRMRYQRVLAKMQLARGEWAGAIRGLEQVLEGGLSAGPGDGVVLRVVYGRALGMAGRMREALSLLDQVEQECLKIQMDSFLTVLRFTKLLLRLEISRAPQTLLDPMQSLKTEALERGETLWVHRIELRQLALQGDAHAASWQTAFGVFRQEQAFADLAAGALLQAETLLETKQETEAAALLEQHATDLIGLGMPWLELVHSSLFAAADRSAAGADFGARGMEQLRSLTAALDEQERDAFLRRPAVQAIRRRLGQRR